MMRLFVVVVALGLGFGAQALLANERPNPVLVVPLFAAAALLAAIALPSDKREPKPGEAVPGWKSTHRGTLPLLGLSLVLIAFSLYLLQAHQWPEVATLAWVGALAAFVGAFAARQQRRTQPSWRFSVGEGAILALIILLGFVLRFVDLENLPPTVHGDEAEFSLSALGFAKGEFTHLFGVGWMHFPTMSMVPYALTMGLFGAEVFGTRLASVVVGLLDVLALYLLLRLMFGRRVALVGAFLLAVSPAHIQFSRIGLNNIQASLAFTAGLYFLARALSSGRRLDFVWSGLILGLSLYLYLGARLLPVVVAVFLGYQILSKRGFLRRRWANLVVMAAMALMTFAPLGLYFLRENPDAFVSRSQQVYLFTEPNRRHFKSTYGTDALGDMIRIQVVNAISTFNWRGDTSLQYGYKGSMLDLFTGPLFVIGLAYSIRRLRDERHLLLLLWFWGVLIVGGVITVDAPFYPRLVSLFPAVYGFVAIAADRALAAGERVLPGRARFVIVLPLLLWLGAVGYLNYHTYFEVFPVRDQPRNWITAVALYMRELSPQYRFYLVTEPILYFDYGTLRFLAPQAQGRSTAEVASLLPITHDDEKGAAFILAMPLQPQLSQLRSWYPGGSYRLHEPGQGRFISYLVSPEELARVAGRRGGWLQCASCSPSP